MVVAGAPHVDVLTGREIEGGTVPLAGLLDRYPVALLAPVDQSTTGEAAS